MKTKVLTALALLVSAFVQAAEPAPLPENVRLEADVPYLPGERKEKADLYFPKEIPAGKPLPAVIVIHGGGFNDGDKAKRREAGISAELASAGYVAMSINYKLWSKGVRNPTWPQSVWDAKSAVAWLRSNATRLGIDPNRIGVLGCSAGGNLASMLATTRPQDQFEPESLPTGISTAVACAVDFYGAVDLPAYHDMKMFLKTRDEAPELYAKASPTKYVHKDAAPILIIHGTADETVNVTQSETLATALKQAGADYELVLIPNAPHGFDLSVKEPDVRSLVLRFLDTHLKGSTFAGGR